MHKATDEMKLAGDSGYWPLYRYDPRLAKDGKNPFQWDSPGEPKKEFTEYLNNEIRYKTLNIQYPDRAKKLFAKAENDAKERYAIGKKLAEKKEDK